MVPLILPNHCNIYNKIQKPLEVKSNDTLIINLNREHNGKKVWYEWNFEIDGSGIDKANSEIHNFRGLKYSIDL